MRLPRSQLMIYVLAGLMTLTAGKLWAEDGQAQAVAETKTIEEHLVVCAACHAETGVSTSGQYPILAGQHEDYLMHSLKAYQNGERQNPIMAGQVANLSEDEIRALARYYARQKSPLYTPALPQ